MVNILHKQIYKHNINFKKNYNKLVNKYINIEKFHVKIVKNFTIDYLIL